MNSFYGKTGNQNWAQSFIYKAENRVREFANDLINLNEVINRRPFLLPSLLVLFTCFISFFTRSYIPSLLISVFVVGLCIYRVGSSPTSPLVLISRIVLALIFSLVFSYIGITMSSRMVPRQDLDATSFEAYVTNVSYELSGDTNVTVRLTEGNYAVVKYYGSDEGFSNISPGFRVLLNGKIKEPSKAGNPGEFDYRNYLRKKGILYIINCDSFEILGSSKPNLTSLLQKAFFNFRKNTLDSVNDDFDDSSKALVAAVCLGDKSLISNDVRRNFNISCCSHLLAVSGTHFSGFLVCLPIVLKAFKIKRKAAFFIHLLFCVAIGCLTGWGDSVTRACIMSVCVFAERDWLSAMSVSSFVMIMANPFAALSSGFQMSFCAVLGIKLYSAKMTSYLNRLRLGETVSKLISPSICASLGMLPFWTDISMRPDFLHLLLQIAGSFLASLVCTVFVPCMVLCMLFPFGSEFFSIPLLICIKLLDKLVVFGSFLSERESVPVHLSNISLMLISICVALFFLPSCFVKRCLFRISCLLLAISIGVNAVSLVNKPMARIIFADVGQGDCCLIITPERTCLIDGGTYDKGASTVSDLLDYYGIWQVDICVISHWDVDHAGGIAALSEKGRTKTILTSYVPSSDCIDKDVNEFIKSTGLTGNNLSDFLSQLELFTAGNIVKLSDTVYLEALYPDLPRGGGNEGSLLAMLHIGGEPVTKILFTGDLGSETESNLIKKGIDLDCDILKVAHHGSKYSSSAEFLESSSPAIAVISVGSGNFYGHPSPYTIERLNTYGCEILRTDLDGAVILEY
ncbi:MAG: ComEC/Rec2 family competence protein [Saccharofermentans sp.]|nr:ComEC/Rec2 family competence protein [Saccharofermentans sp.]